MSNKNERYSARRRKLYLPNINHSLTEILIRMNDTPQGDGNFYNDIRTIDLSLKE